MGPSACPGELGRCTVSTNNRWSGLSDACVPNVSSRRKDQQKQWSLPPVDHLYRCLFTGFRWPIGGQPSTRLRLQSENQLNKRQPALGDTSREYFQLSQEPAIADQWLAPETPTQGIRHLTWAAACFRSGRASPRRVDRRGAPASIPADRPCNGGLHFAIRLRNSRAGGRILTIVLP